MVLNLILYKRHKKQNRQYETRCQFIHLQLILQQPPFRFLHLRL